MAPSDLVVTDQMDRVVGSTEPTRAPRIDVSDEGIKTGVAALLQRVDHAPGLVAQFAKICRPETQKARPSHIKWRGQASFGGCALIGSAGFKP